MKDIDFCTRFDELPTTPIADATSVTVLEDPGTIKIVHGRDRAHLGTGTFIKIEQTAELPAYATHATVFLNGWRLGYSGGDHHVEGLATFIRNIRPGRARLTWNAMGILVDDGHDKPYDFTCTWTLIAWNDARLFARVDHDDADEVCRTKEPGIDDNFFWTRNRDTTTALAVFPTFLFGIPSFQHTAVLPRGFGWGWGEDHHLLQFAYHLDSAETVIQNRSYKKDLGDMNPHPDPEALVDSGYVTWNSCVIVKDDSDRRDYFFGEVVSGLGGEDVDTIQPPFHILPLGSADGALGGAGVKSKEVVVEAIPYQYAIPMLTGWDIGYTAGDQHVKEIGVWIDSFSYEWTPGSPAGRLRYKVSSVLHDDDTWPDNFFRHKVTMLCLKHAPTKGTAPEP